MRTALAFAMALAACTTEASSDPAPTRRAPTFSRAQYDAHIATLKQRLAAKRLGHLNVRIEDPFVVVGNGSMSDLERSSQTVRWAADHLEASFFDKRPGQILDIYLFVDKQSYEQGVLALTGERPGTPYGFYSSSERGLFMNIATGGGTLVHEIVHPYVEADFPDAPPWLNEGLGSLFEQSAERDGRIVGLTNWRLEGLQRAIGKRQVPSFRALTSLGSNAFYRDDRGTNYAQSRYLMYYLQEQGRLRSFYKAFRAARQKDPTGFATLQSALGERDMVAFKSRWEAYVAKLRFP